MFPPTHRLRPGMLAREGMKRLFAFVGAATGVSLAVLVWRAAWEPLWHGLATVALAMVVLACFKRTRPGAWWLLHFSGLRLIAEKIHPPWIDRKKRPSSFFIWAFGIYTGLYSLAVTQHELMARRIQDRANHFGAIVSQKEIKVDMWRDAGDIQAAVCSLPPTFGDPVSTFQSFFGSGEPYAPVVAQIQNYVRISKGDLAGADLTGIDLRGVNMRGAKLRGARLENARLDGADFYNAVLERAQLVHVSMEKTKFRSANLKIAQFKACKAKGADFTGADLTYAGIYGVDFRNAKFEKAVFKPFSVCDVLIFEGPISSFEAWGGFKFSAIKIRTTFEDASWRGARKTGDPNVAAPGEPLEELVSVQLEEELFLNPQRIDPRAFDEFDRRFHHEGPIYVKSCD